MRSIPCVYMQRDHFPTSHLPLITNEPIQPTYHGFYPSFLLGVYVPKLHICVNIIFHHPGIGPPRPPFTTPPPAGSPAQVAALAPEPGAQAGRGGPTSALGGPAKALVLGGPALVVLLSGGAALATAQIHMQTWTRTRTTWWAAAGARSSWGLPLRQAVPSLSHCWFWPLWSWPWACGGGPLPRSDLPWTPPSLP